MDPAKPFDSDYAYADYAGGKAVGMRKKLDDGRFADPNGTIEEKFLHYFLAFTESEKVGRTYLLENQSLREQIANFLREQKTPLPLTPVACGK